MAGALDSVGVRRAYQHLFLPPKLPQAADEGSVEALQFARLAHGALTELRQNLPATQRPIALDQGIALINSLLTVNSVTDASVSEPKLLHQIQTLSTTASSGTTVACYIAAQNAAVLISRVKQDDSIKAGERLVFEAFELSPHNSAVYQQSGRLCRSFPGPAMAVSLEKTSDANFAPAVAATLSAMSAQPVDGMQPTSRKSRSHHDEIRDTTNPAAVTDLFLGFLRSFGKPVLVDYISKNTREEVLWQSALAPWRRSPVWLLVRVALQIVMSRASDGSRKMYKQAMTFIMARILQEAQRLDFPSEDLHVMNAKISARLIKLSARPDEEASLHLTAVNMIHEALRSSAALIQRRWENIQQRDSHKLDLRPLSSLDFRGDVCVALPGLDTYLARLRANDNLGSQARRTTFVPQSSLMLSDGSSLPRLPTSASHDLSYANVHHFEDWVAKHLTDWVKMSADPDVCEDLCTSMLQYHRLATSLYAGNPEATSVMILTIFELFIACDRAAIKHCNLLERYDPGIPQAVLQNLLLPRIDGLNRLLKIEAYLDTRSSRSSYPSSSLFDLRGSTGFAYQSFEQSSQHKDLYKKIQDQAALDKDTKRVQFQQLQREYQRLSAKYEQSQCEYKDVVIDDWCDPPETESRHQPGCEKCRYQNQMSNMSIDVFEEPLPRFDVEAKSIVFELAVPSWIAYWRDARMHLLVDVLRDVTPSAGLQASYELSCGDPHLSHTFYMSKKSHRVDLLSESKPVVNTHYRNKRMRLLRETDVIVDNGLHYRYWDSKARVFLGHLSYGDDVAESCTYDLPSRALQRFVWRPSSMPDGEAPNAVIASLDKCPDDMSLEEYKELSTLPLGRHIQWSNIELQLAMPSVDFKKQLTTLVFLQCVHQTGPSNGHVLRDAHNTLRDDVKVESILKHLSEAVDRVKQNWESAEALGTFTAIAARLLSVNRSCKDHALNVLSKIRTVAATWMHTLNGRAHAAEEQEHRNVFVTKSVEVALLCTFTYDVDEEYLSFLLADVENASRLLQAAVAVQQGENSHDWRDLHSKLLLFRHKRLLHRCYPLLSQNQAGLDVALRQVWSAYKPGASGWSPVSKAASHWVATETSDCMQVHVDLLSGEVRVNSMPLGLIPSQYRNQPLYARLFGRSAVEILPAPDPRFEFSTKKEFEGQVVQLALREGASQAAPTQELVVQAVEDSEVYETVSSHLFKQCFPDHFVQDYVHWYHAASKTVHFRPDSTAWNTDRTTGWVLSLSSGSRWTLSRAGNALVGLQTDTSRTVGKQLSPLTIESRTHCILLGGTSALRVDIPSLRLAFSLESHSASLRSREYRSMHVDSDQSLGTLIGLKNKLVLKAGSGERLVLLPEASVSWTKDSGHISVSVDKSSIKRVHAVAIDTLLRGLKDSGDLQGKLYLAYLHALTSHCYPDPFTSCTGTESALTILRSSAVHSFDRLTMDNVEILAKIAHLSPGRSFYPTWTRVMQTVSWDAQLGFMAQHGAFSAEVQTLFDQARRNSVFFPVPALPQLPFIEASLEKRYSNRAAQFRVAGFGAEACDYGDDGVYASRDDESARGTRSAQIATLLLRDSLDLAWQPLSANQLWNEIETLSTVKGPSSAIPGVRYNADYAADNGHLSILQNLPSLLLWLQDQAPQVPEQRHIVAAWLAALGYSKTCKLEVLQILVHAFKGEFAGITPPALESFRPNQGKELLTVTVQQVVDRHRYGRPEAYLERRKNEKWKNYGNRCQTAWNTACNDAKQRLMSRIVSQWPCRVPTSPSANGIAPYFDVQKIINGIKPLFAAWHDNMEFYKYLEQLAARLRNATMSNIQLPALQRQDAPLFFSVAAHVAPGDLFANRAPTLMSSEIPILTVLQEATSAGEKAEEPRMVRFVERQKLSTVTSSAFGQGYIAGLSESVDALKVVRDNGQAAQAPMPLDALKEHREECQRYTETAYAKLVSAARRTQHTASLTVHQFPRISPSLFLKQLSRTHWNCLPGEWKTSIIAYALALAALQRADRLVKFASHSRNEELVNELHNRGHTNWDPMQHPESLLIEVESGLLIRSVQEDIAAQMRNPSSNRNAVMQLNMGEGKSSVIVPIVAAALADGQQLLRVIVAKPQSKQMAQMLISKLGGLVGRRVYYMPFSRSIKLDERTAKLIHSMLQECMINGGILLVQPEHILSLKLAAPQCYVTGKPDVGKSLMSTQDFFDRSARDIVDESDENFSARFELIYTMGTQSSIEASPDRWYLIQQVLELVAVSAPSIAESLPRSIEVHTASVGSFPRVRILRADAAEMLINKVVAHIQDSGLNGFQLSRQPQRVREAVSTYIKCFDLSDAEIDAVEKGPFWTDATKTCVLLLRGLFAGGILAFALGQKRWRVNYGLAVRDRATKLAVPYRAKDCPSPRSEFSHPDVVLTLTMLCYYYEGSTDEELFVSLAHLMDSDQADAEYQAWVGDMKELPSAFRQLQGINLKDRLECIANLFPYLRRSKNVADYHLSHIVFPKEMKQFPHKLSASGWDIGKAKGRLTTGFSGTNDSRCLLPLDVGHLHLPDQMHTNALVLEYLLRPENTVEMMSPARRGSSDAQHLLDAVGGFDPPVQVILDVGAQILELNNEQVAIAWLKASATAKEAAIFVNDSDDLCVVDRSGRIDLLQTSSFASRLDVCLVFLDECHTR